MTLTQTAIIVQRGIIIFVAALILGIAGFTSYKIWYNSYLRSLPQIEEKPDTKFGILPAIQFPTSNVSSANFLYSLDTETGNLPKIGIDKGFDKNVKVYFVIQTSASLLSPEKTQALAEKFEISSQPEIISDTKYKFTSEDKALLVDLDTGNFLYTNEATKAENTPLAEDELLVSGFKKILSSIGILNEDLSNGVSKINLLKVSGSDFISTREKTEARAAQISLWPQALENKAIYTASFDNSLVNAVVLESAQELKNYASLDFTYYPIDNTTYATYPLKSTDDAFEELKNGKGIVVVEPDKPQVSITSVSLGYYLGKNYSPYLQPIFVFEGPQFAAYVPAVVSEFVGNVN